MRVSSAGASFDSTQRMVNDNVFGARVVHFRNVPVVKGKVKAICTING
jgi:hypothetical protein